MGIRILEGDCRVTLRTLPAGSVQSVITSPPYYALRSYSGDPVTWGDGWIGHLGLEPTPVAYVQHLLECFREVHRVLKDDGTLWVNLGMSSSGSHGNGYKQTMHKVNYTSGRDGNFDLAKQIKRKDTGWKDKDIIQIPFFASEALREDGWYLRSVIPWAKISVFPESVTDRPAASVEYVHLFSKSRYYYYDSNAVRTDTRHLRNGDWLIDSLRGLIHNEIGDPLALVVSPTGFAGKHYAAFSPKFVEPMLKASTRPGDTALDPFGGSGTVALVADRLGRNGISCELSPDYTDISDNRLVGDSPMFASVTKIPPVSVSEEYVPIQMFEDE